MINKLVFTLFIFLFFLSKGEAHQVLYCMNFEAFMQSASVIIRRFYNEQLSIGESIQLLEEQVQAQSTQSQNTCPIELIQLPSKVIEDDDAIQNISYLICKGNLNDIVRIALHYSYQHQLIHPKQFSIPDQVTILTNFMNKFHETKLNCQLFSDTISPFFDVLFELASHKESTFNPQLCDKELSTFSIFRSKQFPELPIVDSFKKQAHYLNQKINQFISCNLKVNLPPIPENLIENMLISNEFEEKFDKIFDQIQVQYQAILRNYRGLDFQKLLQTILDMYKNSLETILQRNYIFDIEVCSEHGRIVIFSLKSLLSSPKKNFRIEGEKLFVLFDEIFEKCALPREYEIIQQDFEFFVYHVQIDDSTILPKFDHISRLILKMDSPSLYVHLIHLMAQLRKWILEQRGMP